MSNSTRPFPIPVVPGLMTGPGSQPEDEPLQYMAMPADMATYQPPSLPEPAELASHRGALQVLHEAHHALTQALAGVHVDPIELTHLGSADRALVNQVLGEGEVSAQVKEADGQGGVQAQESVFAGLWRVLYLQGGVVQRDTLEVGPIPNALLDAAAADGQPPRPVGEFPAGVMNAPSIYEELADRQRRWQLGQAAHVINLTLLPLTPQDSLWLTEQLSTGRVMVLSRGYGNCRIVNTQLRRTWRVTYFNASDIIILDTLEVGTVPEVACAARDDLEDSAERLHEVLQWVEQS
jgi:hydrogenase-1 operon protein HyaF